MNWYQRGFVAIFFFLAMAVTLSFTTGFIACGDIGNDDDDDATTDDDDDGVDDDSVDDDDNFDPPEFSSNHDSSWNCYVCHSDDFFHSPAEPHDGVYDAPDDCVSCHHQGSFLTDPVKEGHNLDQNCLECHSSRHGKPWEDKSQCLLCHGDEGEDE